MLGKYDFKIIKLSLFKMSVVKISVICSFWLETCFLCDYPYMCVYFEILNSVFLFAVLNVFLLMEISNIINIYIPLKYLPIPPKTCKVPQLFFLNKL